VLRSLGFRADKLQSCLPSGERFDGTGNNFPQHRTNYRNSRQAAAGSSARLHWRANNRRRAMKPYILMLLISTIVVVCNLVGRRKTIKRERARVPLPSTAGRHIDWRRALERLS
jgi:hypothetical protein